MKNIDKTNNSQITKLALNGFLFITLLLALLFSSCSDDESCGYTINPDCDNLGLNIGDPCDFSGDGVNDGTVNNDCECIEIVATFDCPQLQKNSGDPCDLDGGVGNGVINDDCDCVPDPPVPCASQTELNLSTGIDAYGNVITPGDGVVDPYWRVINNPPLIACSDPSVSTINGDAYVINYAGNGPDGWVNQTGSTTLAPMDLGTNRTFACNNASNANGDRVPYVFERPFCVLDDTCIDFSFTLKGDDQVYFELIDNSSPVPLDTSPTYVWSSSAQNWTASNLCLTAGSYSIRAYLVNVNSTVLGFSLVGSLVTTDESETISNNAGECCINNVISVLNVLEENCNNVFDNGVDSFGVDWIFNLKDSSGAIIRTENTDANGNVFFSGLPDGTYTVEIVSQSGWLPNNPASGAITLTVSNNEVQILEFFSCPNN